MEILSGSPKHAASRYVEWLITGVVLINCSAVVMDSVPEVHAQYSEFFSALETWSVFFFHGGVPAAGVVAGGMFRPR